MPQEHRDHLKAQLDQRLLGFEFEQGAVLVHVPQVPLDLMEPEVARNRGYFAYPPQGLLYLSATLRLLGIETRIVDLNLAVLRESQGENPDLAGAWRKALEEALAPFPNPFVCVSFLFDLTFPQLKEVCEYVKVNKPGVCIALGGVSATADPDRLLIEGLADLVFSHEGERTLESFYGYIRDRETRDNKAGEKEAGLPINLSFLDSSGGVMHTPTATGGEVELDIRDEYACISINKYHLAGSLSNFSRMEGVDVPFAPVLSRRGCRARCSFCGVRNFNGKNVRVRDADAVVSEMEHLHYNHGIRHFDWLDDDLLFDGKAALELSEKMASRLPEHYATVA